MKIIVVGQGEVGFNVSKTLVREGHDVAVIEKDEQLFQNVTDKLDVLAIHGSGICIDNLVAAGIKSADVVIAATAKDEVNILVCGLSAQFGVKTRIARLFSVEYTEKTNGIDISQLGVTHHIIPELLTVDTIRQYIETPGATEVASFGNQQVLLLGSKLTADSALVNTKISDNKILSDHQEPLLIAGIDKKNEFVIPSGDYTFEEGDNVITLQLASSCHNFYNLFGLEEKKVKKVVLSGASLLGIKAAQMLEKIVPQVILIEPEEAVAIQAAELLSKTQVIRGNFDEDGLLDSINIDNADFFIAVHKKTSDNMMAAMIASESGVKETMFITTDSRHQLLFYSIGIRHIVNPYLLTSAAILDIVRGDRINSITEIGNGQIEVLELVVEEKSPIDGKELKSIWEKIHGKALVGAVVRDDQVIISKGSTTMHANDRAIVLCKKEYLLELEAIFLKNTVK